MADDPFSALDPIMRSSSKTPMGHSRGFKSADAGSASCKTEEGGCETEKLALESTQKERSTVDSHAGGGSQSNVSITGKEANAKAGASLLDS